MNQIDETLVQQLVAEQFPALAHLKIQAVVKQGWDNHTYRLGQDLLVRLPSAERYAAQVNKEQLWLPFIASKIKTPIPSIYARGAPGCGYLWDWSIYHWIEGHDIDYDQRPCELHLANNLSAFLQELHCVDADKGPQPGAHNFYRGAPLQVYAKDTYRYVEALGSELNHDAVVKVWESALATQWEANPVWVHGDLEATNLLLRNNRWHAVLDFGSCAVGDPACDLVMAWTFFSNAGYLAFRRAVDMDDSTWARAKGWALWKALFKMHNASNKLSNDFQTGKSVIEALLAE